MGTGWNGAEEAAKRMKEGGKFLRIKDGESAQVVFRGEPRTFYHNFKDKTEHDEWAEGRAFRMRINVVVNADGKYQAKILEMGSGFMQDLLTMRNDPEVGLDRIFTLKRTGSGAQDTRYTLIPKNTLTPEQLKSIAEVQLNDLARGRDRKDEAVDQRGAHDDDVPF